MQTEGLKPFLFKSSLIHLIFILLLTVHFQIFKRESMVSEDVMRVDLVGLPDKLTTLPETLPEPKAPEPEPQAAVKPPAQPEAAIPLKVTKKAPETKKVDTKDAIKRIQALAQMQTQLENQKKAQLQNMIRGQELSRGHSLTGEARLNYQDYLGDINRKIKSQWLLPNWLLEMKLSAQVEIKVDRTGMITEIAWIKKSGNDSFDQEILAALKNSVPLPLPPESIQNYLSSQGIKVGFPE